MMSNLELINELGITFTDLDYPLLSVGSFFNTVEALVSTTFAVGDCRCHIEDNVLVGAMPKNLYMDDESLYCLQQFYTICKDYQERTESIIDGIFNLHSVWNQALPKIEILLENGIPHQIDIRDKGYPDTVNINYRVTNPTDFFVDVMPYYEYLFSDYIISNKKIGFHILLGQSHFFLFKLKKYADVYRYVTCIIADKKILNSWNSFNILLNGDPFEILDKTWNQIQEFKALLSEKLMTCSTY